MDTHPLCTRAFRPEIVLGPLLKTTLLCYLWEQLYWLIRAWEGLNKRGSPRNMRGRQLVLSSNGTTYVLGFRLSTRTLCRCALALYRLWDIRTSNPITLAYPGGLYMQIHGQPQDLAL